MFDQVEVPAELVTDGVLRCRVPMHYNPGTVSFCVTRGNFRLFTDVYTFEYKKKDILPYEISSPIDERSFKLKIVENLERLEREVNTWNPDPVPLTDRLMDSLQLDLSEDQIENIFVKILCTLMEKLDHYQSIDTQDFSGLTMLHYSVAMNYKNLASALIRLGANINLPDKTGCSPFQLAVKNNNQDMLKILIENSNGIPVKSHGKVRDLSPPMKVEGLISGIDRFQLEENSPLHTPTSLRKFKDSSSNHSSPRTPVKSRQMPKIEEVCPSSPLLAGLKDYRIRRVEKAEDESKKRISKARDHRIAEKRR